MASWEEFEIECTEYLNSRFGEYAKFYHEGGSDSTVPDIRVETTSGKIFYIEAKHSPAQCGQFVLLPDIASETFIYSPQNATRINTHVQKIMEHMNQQFDVFKEAGTSGKDIIMENDSTIFSDWIIQTYQDKGVRYFITNHFTLLPIERFKEYFNVTATYRVKRSGSGDVGKNNIPFVSNYIKSNDYAAQEIYEKGNKLFVLSDQSLHNQRFILRGSEYMFSMRNSEYEIRKLSNTFNANVIFSIELNREKVGLSDVQFIEQLK